MNPALTNFLLELSARADAEGLDPYALRLHVRREDLADHLGLTTDALERALEELRSRGIVTVGPQDTVTILDRSALESTAARRASGHAVPRERAESALRAILGDERFLATPRTSALLVYLVEQAMAGGGGHVDIDRAAAEVLGRPAGFDAEDPALRVLVTRLRRMLDDYDARTPDAAVAIRLERGAFRVVIESRPGAFGP